MVQGHPQQHHHEVPVITSPYGILNTAVSIAEFQQKWELHKSGVFFPTVSIENGSTKKKQPLST